MDQVQVKVGELGDGEPVQLRREVGDGNFESLYDETGQAPPDGEPCGQDRGRYSGTGHDSPRFEPLRRIAEKGPHLVEGP